MPASLIDFTLASENGASAVTVTLSSTPAAGDVLVMLAAAGPLSGEIPTVYVETDVGGSVVLDPGLDQSNLPAYVACRLVRCVGGETTLTFGINYALGTIVVGVWRIADEAQIEPYPIGSDAGGATVVPSVPAFVATAAGFALHLLVSTDTAPASLPAGWTDDGGSFNFISWQYLSRAVVAGSEPADPYGAVVGDDWSSVVIAVSDLGTILAPVSGTGTAWGARVSEAGPAEIPPPLPADVDEYPPLPPVSPSVPVPLPPWVPGPQYRPEEQ